MSNMCLIKQISRLDNSLKLWFAWKHLIEKECLKWIREQRLSFRNYNFLFFLRMNILVQSVCVVRFSQSQVSLRKCDVLWSKEVANSFLGVGRHAGAWMVSASVGRNSWANLDSIGFFFFLVIHIKHLLQTHVWFWGLPLFDCVFRFKLLGRWPFLPNWRFLLWLRRLPVILSWGNDLMRRSLVSIARCGAFQHWSVLSLNSNCCWLLDLDGVDRCGFVGLTRDSHWHLVLKLINFVWNLHHCLLLVPLEVASEIFLLRWCALVVAYWWSIANCWYNPLLLRIPYHEKWVVCKALTPLNSRN